MKELLRHMVLNLLTFLTHQVNIQLSILQKEQNDFIISCSKEKHFLNLLVLPQCEYICHQLLCDGLAGHIINIYIFVFLFQYCN